MCEKKAYTKIEARQAVDGMMKAKRQNRVPAKIYFCTDCNAWHLSSQSQHGHKTMRPYYKDKYKNYLKQHARHDKPNAE